IRAKKTIGRYSANARKIFAFRIVVLFSDVLFMILRNRRGAESVRNTRNKRNTRKIGAFSSYFAWFALRAFFRRMSSHRGHRRAGRECGAPLCSLSPAVAKTLHAFENRCRALAYCGISLM